MLQHAGKRMSNRFFALFFIAQFITFSGYLLRYSPEPINKVPFLFHITDPLWFVWAPTLYLAIRFETEATTGFNWKQVFHFLPALLVIIYLIFAFHLESFAAKKILLTDRSLLTDKWMVQRIMEIQILSYNFLAALSLEKYIKSIKYLTKQTRVRVHWNRFILYTYFAACVIYDIKVHLLPHYINAEISYTIDLVIFFVYFGGILFRAISSSHFSASLEKERTTSIDKKEANLILSKLEELMYSEKLYLELDLSIGIVAEKLKTKENHLSEVLNSYKKQNFNEYINQFRLEEAKRLLLDSRNNHQTILEIVYASGFNSKSSFNQAFKTYTGMTPTQYKKSKTE